MADRIPLHEIVLVDPKVAHLPYNGRGRPRLYSEAKVGDRFGSWTVIAYWLPDVEHGNARRICVRCDCGNWRVHRENTIISGGSRSCGHKNTPYGNKVVTGLEVDRSKEKRRRRELLQQVLARVQAIEINVIREKERRADAVGVTSASSDIQSTSHRVVSLSENSAGWHRRIRWEALGAIQSSQK